jgi:soluble cytochrome b562
MPAGRTTIVAVLAGFGLLAAGCGGGQQQGAGTTTTPPPATSTTGGVDQGKVNFAGDLCGAVAKFLVPATGYKPDTSSAAAAVASLKTQLGKMSTGLAEAATDVKNADTSSVPDGEKVVTDLEKTFQQMKQTVDGAKAKLDAVNPNNQQAVAAAVQEVSKDLTSLGSLSNPLDQPSLKSADMEAAAEKAPECQQIKESMTPKTTGASTPPTS